MVSVEGVNEAGERTSFAGDYFFSTMPVRDLVRAIAQREVPREVTEVSEGLMYRDFITVGLLASSSRLRRRTAPRSRTTGSISRSRMWLVGRLQIFNNWSPWLVKPRG